jgi:hypothetical protein
LEEPSFFDRGAKSEAVTETFSFWKEVWLHFESGAVGKGEVRPVTASTLERAVHFKPSAQPGFERIARLVHR